jgi:integrase
MAQTARDGRLEKRSNRLKLKQGIRHFKVLDSGVALCYRRTSDSFGTWSVRIALADGRYRLEVLGTADDHSEANGETVLSFGQAQSLALARHLQIQRDGGIVKGPFTVAQAVEHYLEWFRVHRRAVASTEANIKAHILPKWGDADVADITTKQIKAWHSALATKPARKRARLGVAVAYRDAPSDDAGKRSRKSTANRILTTFKAILNKAYDDELVPSNEVWKRVKPFEDVDEPIVRFLKPDEAKRLLNACAPDLRALVAAALHTGARYSELAGAGVSDYSPDNRSLYIRPSKSGKGRHIPLTDEGNAHFAASATGKTGKALMFTRADGVAWGKNYHVRPLLEACRNAKIEPATGFHELRHTYASLLAQAGADLLTISKLLGHADTRITSRHYAHLCDRTLANAVNRFLPSFGSVPKGKVSPIKNRAA